MNHIIDKSHNQVNVKSDKCSFDICQPRQYWISMDYEKFIEILEKYVADEHGGNVSGAARALGMNGPAFGRWVNRERTANAEDMLSILRQLGYRLTPPSSDTTREICFVDTKVVRSGDGLPPPIPEHYAAVPLVGEVGAGPGMVAQDQLEGWVLVMRDQQSIRTRSNLLAVEVGKNQNSMTPTLHPGDIVLVDRDDWGQYGTYKAPGNIFLVREPGQEGGAKVKRVDLSGKGNAAILTFYSDNSEEYGPEPHIMTQDYPDGLRDAIIGRVVWAWSDVSRK